MEELSRTVLLVPDHQDRWFQLLQTAQPQPFQDCTHRGGDHPNAFGDGSSGQPHPPARTAHSVDIPRGSILSGKSMKPHPTGGQVTPYWIASYRAISAGDVLIGASSARGQFVLSKDQSNSRSHVLGSREESGIAMRLLMT